MKQWTFPVIGVSQFMIQAAIGLFLAHLINPAMADESDYGWQSSFYGPGLLGEVFAVTEFEGHLIVGGQFLSAGSERANHVAIWDGSDWQALAGPDGNGFSAPVRALAVFDGELYAGGHFRYAGESEVNFISRWDGKNWQPLPGPGGVGVMSISVDALTVFDDHLIVGGHFDSAGGIPAMGLARWNGSEWSDLDSAPDSGFAGVVNTLTSYQDELIAGGNLSLTDGDALIARWDGTQWQQLNGPDGGSLLGGWVHVLSEFQGDLIAGGTFSQADGQAASGIARWDGHSWQPLVDGDANGVSLNGVRSVAIFDGELIVGGSFFDPEPRYLARWTGSTWDLVGGKSERLRSEVYAMHAHGDKLLVGTTVTDDNGLISRGLVSWDGMQWQPLPETGNSGFDSLVLSLAFIDENLIAGGNFLTAGDQLVNGVARWDQATWHSYGNDPADHWLWEPSALIEFDGALVAAGGYIDGDHFGGVARWDETLSSWVELTSPNGQGIPGWVEALAIFEDELIAAGSFSQAGGVQVNNIARWNGSEWQALTGSAGTGTGSRNYALTLFNNDLIVGGWFTSAGGIPANYVARWDGTEWHPVTSPGNSGLTHFGSGQPGVKALVVHQGELYAGGRFRLAGGFAANDIARFDGTFWRPLVGQEVGGNGLTSPTAASRREVLSLSSNGPVLIVGGRFNGSGDQGLFGLASWDGRNWGPIGTPNHTDQGERVMALLYRPSVNELYVGGLFRGIGNAAAWHLGHFRWQTGSVEITSISDTNPLAGTPVTVTVQATGEPYAPILGLGVVYSSSGESCHSEQIQALDETTSQFTCNIVFAAEGEASLTAAISPAWTHLMTPSDSQVVTVEPPEIPIFTDRFEVSPD